MTDPPGHAETAPSALPDDGHGHDHHHDHAHQQRSRLHRAVYALHLVVGRGPVARHVADLARLTPADRVVDIGCGPGTAVRIAASRGASATGIDPDPTMLRYARRLGAMHPRRRARFAQGSAEALPLPDGDATVVWTLSSVHHWSDRAAGLAEALRVLAPGGRLLLVERLKVPGPAGRRTHGLTEPEIVALVGDVDRAGFTAVRWETHTVGRKVLAVVRGSKG